MRRALQISLASVFVLVVMVITGVLSTLIWIGGTESGTQFAWRHAEDFLPPSVEIHALDGRLAGPLEIRGVKVTNSAFELEIDKFNLDWQPWKLWNRTLAIESIMLNGVRYTQLEETSEKTAKNSTPVSLPKNIELPLGIEVHIGEAILHDLRFNSAPDNTYFEINTARLKAGMDDQKIAVSSLAVDSPQFSLEGNALLKTHGDFPLQGELNWRVPLPDYPALEGHTLLDGTLREMEISQRIAKPYDTQGTLLLKNPLGDLAFELSWIINPLQLQSLNKELPPLSTRMAITGEGTPNAFTFNLDGWVEHPDMERLHTTLAGGFESRTITIDELKVGVAQQPTEVTGNGRLEIADTPAFNVTLRWDQFQWPLQEPTVKSSAGYITLEGKIDAYTFNAMADVEVPQQTDAALQLEGQGDLTGLHVSHIGINTLEGRLNGEAKLSWTPELVGDIQLSGQNLNPDKLLPAWPGNLAFSLQAQSGMDAGHPYLKLEHFSTQGQLRGYKVSLNATGSYADNITTLKRVALSSGESRLDVSGTLSDTFDLNWQIQSKNLDSLLPHAAGSLKGTGLLSGPLKKPRIKATLNADGLAYQEYRVKSLNLDANVDVAGDAQSNVLLNVDNAYMPGVELRSLAFNARGTPQTHTLTLKADTSRGEADIALQGDLKNAWQDNMIWEFSLNRAELKYPELDAWTLQKPSLGQISAAEAMLEEVCWKSGDALLCLQGKRGANNVEADFSLSDLPFAYLSPYLPFDLDVQGDMSGNGSYTQAGGKYPSFTVNLETSKIQLLSRFGNEEQEREDLIIEFLPADLRAHMEHGDLQAQLQLPISQTDGINFRGNLSQGQHPLMKRPLNAEINMQINNLNFIDDLFPDVQNLSGRITGQMSIAGSLEAPVLQGDLALLDGKAQLERPGLNLKDIEVKLSGEGANGVQLDAHAASGDGVLNIGGNSALRGNADISVKGENFRVFDTFEAQIDATPDLSITVRQKRIDVEGELLIPAAQITLKELPKSAVKVSKDQVIIKSEKKNKETASIEHEIYAQVHAVLGDKVHFDGFGLKARIEGDILVNDRPGEPTTASGELNIKDGEYRAYGQGLVIEKGNILFSGGPIHQPGLDVRAVRRPTEDITVGVQVKGDLRKPDFNLFSDPSMTQGNQLSYLVLGRPLSGTTESESSALSRASLALGLKGGNIVTEKIGTSLGLDQFGLAPVEAGSNSNPANASFVIGKYLSPKLYISYGLGLFKQTSIIQLRYTISKHLKLKTESANEASGADLIYEIETGK